MVDDDLEVAVRAALVLERVFDLGYRALERREVVLAHGRRAVGVEDRLAVLEANRLRANREARTSVSIRHRNREAQTSVSTPHRTVQGLMAKPLSSLIPISSPAAAAPTKYDTAWS